SPGELAVSEAAGENGILILPESAGPPGRPLKDALGIDEDVVFDLDVTPNRPDALSVAGVARDLAAALKVPFELPVVDRAARRAASADATVAVLDPDLCPRFSATVLEEVAVGPSPQW